VTSSWSFILQLFREKLRSLTAGLFISENLICCENIFKGQYMTHHLDITPMTYVEYEICIIVQCGPDKLKDSCK